MIRPSVWQPLLEHFEHVDRIDGIALGELVDEKARACNVPAAHPIRGQLLILAVDSISLLRRAGVPFTHISVPWLFTNYRGPYARRAQLMSENLQN